MSGPTRAALGSVLALSLLVAIGVFTRFAYTATPSEAAVLRLAWRARVPLVEACRELSAEEQAELPVHMRRDEVCEGRVASYRLEVAVDGEVRRRGTVSGAGARGDRPIYVFETLPLTPGPHRIRVLFTRIDAGAGDGRSAGGTAGGPGGAGAGTHTVRAGAETVPERLVLERRVDVTSRDIVLVSYDPEGRTLVLR